MANKGGATDLASSYHRWLLDDDIIQPEQFGVDDQLIRTWQWKDKEFELELFFEEATAKTADRLKMIMTLPDDAYFSIGFGRNMNEVDMVAWHANGVDSYVKDYYSLNKYAAPAEDDIQNFETETPKLIGGGDDTRVQFISYRDLDTGDDEQDYVVPLDEQIDMVYAIHDTWEWKEHKAKGKWSMKVHRGLGNKVEPQTLVSGGGVVTPDDLTKTEDETDSSDLFAAVFLGIICGLVVLICVIGFIGLCVTMSKTSKRTQQPTSSSAVREGELSNDNRA